jgi:hypothetical protein
MPTVMRQVCFGALDDTECIPAGAKTHTAARQAADIVAAKTAKLWKIAAQPSLHIDKLRRYSC